MHHILFLFVLVVIVVFLFLSWGSISAWFGHLFHTTVSSASNVFAPQSSGGTSASGIMATIKGWLAKL